MLACTRVHRWALPPRLAPGGALPILSPRIEMVGVRVIVVVGTGSPGWCWPPWPPPAAALELVGWGRWALELATLGER